MATIINFNSEYNKDTIPYINLKIKLILLKIFVLQIEYFFLNFIQVRIFRKEEGNVRVEPVGGSVYLFEV